MTAPLAPSRPPRPPSPAWPWVAVALLLALPALALGWAAWPAIEAAQDAGDPRVAVPAPLRATPLAPRLAWSRTAEGLPAITQHLTAAWVHGSARHLAANLGGTVVVALLGVSLLRERRLARRAAAAWLLAWPLTHLGLLVDPRLDIYAGASGVLHAGVAVLGWAAWRAPRGMSRTAAPGLPHLIGPLLLAGLAAKVITEAPWAAATLHRPGWDLPIAPLGHATGAIAGLLTAMGLLRGRPGA